MHVRVAAYYLLWHSAVRTVNAETNKRAACDAPNRRRILPEHVTAQERAGNVILFLLYFKVCFVVEGAGRVSATVLLHSRVSLWARPRGTAAT